MKIILLLLSLSATSILTLQAQEKGITIHQDPKFEELLNAKRNLNSSLPVEDHYKIQIYYGDNESSKRKLSEFKKDFKTLDGIIIFNTPNYKVLIGNFKTKIEAERNLEEIRKKYPYAIIIDPVK